MTYRLRSIWSREGGTGLPVFRIRSVPVICAMLNAGAFADRASEFGDPVGVDEISDADVVRSGADRRDRGVEQLLAQRQNAGGELDAHIVDDFLHERRLFVQVLATRCVHRRLIGARDDAALIVEKNQQIGAEGLPALLELSGDAHQVDDLPAHRFLDVGDELRIVA